jgi:sugar lactone lactonase YvrE
MMSSRVCAGYVYTLAGGSTSGWADGQGTNTLFNSPLGIALDSLLNVYVTDYGNNVLRVINASGSVSTLAGNHLVSGFVDGSGSNAAFSGIVGAAVDFQRNIFIADYYNTALRKVTVGGIVTTVFQQSGCYFQGLAFSSGYVLYVAEAGNNVVSTISTSGTATRVVVAGAVGVSGYADGQGTHASFFAPSGIAFSPAGVLFVADRYNYCIRQIDSTGTLLL